MRIAKLLKTVVVLALLGALPLSFWCGRRFAELQRVGAEYLSQSRFAQIRLALLLYHDDHGAFPPTKYRTTPDGPIHSWRVLMLPYLNTHTRELYAKYDFSQPWNSAHNLAVAESAERHLGYFTLGRGQKDTHITNYLAIGDGDQWPTIWQLKARVVTRGEERFMVFEYPHSDIRWTEPKY